MSNFPPADRRDEVYRVEASIEMPTLPGDEPLPIKELPVHEFASKKEGNAYIDGINAAIEALYPDDNDGDPEPPHLKVRFYQRVWVPA